MFPTPLPTIVTSSHDHVIVSFTCHLDWDVGYPSIWSNVYPDEGEGVFGWVVGAVHAEACQKPFPRDGVSVPSDSYRHSAPACGDRRFRGALAFGGVHEETGSKERVRNRVDGREQKMQPRGRRTVDRTWDGRGQCVIPGTALHRPGSAHSRSCVLAP